MTSIWIAFVMDVILGDPYWFPHPVRGIGRYIQVFEKHILKMISTNKGKKIAGVLLLCTTVIFVYGTTFYLLIALGRIHPWLYWIGNIVILWTCLASRCLQKESMKIYRALAEGDISKARVLLSYIVGRDTERLSKEEVIRGTVETVMENTSDGVIAPLIYMIIGGSPLAMTYKAINTLDSMVGYKNEKYFYFGWASAKVDDLVNFLPARITGISISVAAFFLGFNGKRSFQTMRKDGKNHSSPNSGYPEAAAAGALGVELGGTNYYFGKPVYKPTIGSAVRPLEIKDIRRANHLMYGSVLIILMIYSVVRFYLNG